MKLIILIHFSPFYLFQCVILGTVIWPCSEMRRNEAFEKSYLVQSFSSIILTRIMSTPASFQPSLLSPDKSSFFSPDLRLSSSQQLTLCIIHYNVYLHMIISCQIWTNFQNVSLKMHEKQKFPCFQTYSQKERQKRNGGSESVRQRVMVWNLVL